MNERITYQDEYEVLSVLNRAERGLTFDEIALNTNLASWKIFAVLEALSYKGHINRTAMRYFLQIPQADIKDPKEQ